jgi:hypothetical protein
MPKSSAINFQRLAIMALYTAGAWASLTVLMVAATWEPQETAMQSGRVILLIMAGVALLMCVVAATARLLSSAAASVPDVDPKP